MESKTQEDQKCQTAISELPDTLVTTGMIGAVIRFLATLKGDGGAREGADLYRPGLYDDVQSVSGWAACVGEYRLAYCLGVVGCALQGDFRPRWQVAASMARADLARVAPGIAPECKASEVCSG